MRLPRVCTQNASKWYLVAAYRSDCRGNGNWGLGGGAGFRGGVSRGFGSDCDQKAADGSTRQALRDGGRP